MPPRGRSPSNFFEADLAAIFNTPGHNDGAYALPVDASRHWLKVFAFIFRREAFLPASVDERTFHQRGIEEGRFDQERVAARLSDLVFKRVFPGLVRAIAKAAPDATLPDVCDAALVLLYRLLFILFAEDRDLLPVRDFLYDSSALREGSWRCRTPQGCRRCLLGNCRAVLDDNRRPVPDDRHRRDFHRIAAL